MAEPADARERSPARSGAVAAPHWAATDAGRHVLETGGNALDACVAMNAMLTVTAPHMCGVGGDLWLLAWIAGEGRLVCLNGSGPAPGLATTQAFRSFGGVPVRGPLTATVPGAVAAWDEALNRWGSKPLSELLSAPIDAAEQGITVTARLGRWIASAADDLAADPVLRRRFFDSRARPLTEGSVLRQPELSTTLRRLSDAGADDLYRGALAQELAASCESAGGLLRREDLEHYRPEWVDPISTTYRGVEVFTTPPNSQGITSLMMLNALTVLGASELPVDSPQFIDALVRAKNAAFRERDRYVSDPAFSEAPIERMLSLNAARVALADRAPATAGPVGGDTVHMCAVDGDGNACSLIQSIYYAFGSCFVAGDTGILLHNRGHYFSLDDRHVNRLEPGKRPLHTLMACIAMEGNRPSLVFGTMGADGQPQTNVQVLQRILGGADAADAVSAPRVLHGRFFLEDDEQLLHIEDAMSEDTIAELGRRGHNLAITPHGDQRMGHANAIEIGPDGPVSAGSDPRSDGAAVVLTGQVGPGDATGDAPLGGPADSRFE